MRVLVTNDDGISSPGLRALAAAAFPLGGHVTVVAPNRDQSGSGTALGPLDLPGRVVFERALVPGLEAAQVFVVDCPPAMAVLTACLGGYGPPPDLVLSGINAGINAGAAVLHSGTVGAALTAANLGLPALAISLEVGRQARWGTATAVAAAAVQYVATASRPGVLNVNVPDVALAGLAGIRPASLAAFGSVRTCVTLADGDQFEITLEAPDQLMSPGSDVSLLGQGFVTVTPLDGARSPAPGGTSAADFLERVLLGPPAPARVAVAAR